MKRCEFSANLKHNKNSNFRNFFEHFQPLYLKFALFRFKDMIECEMFRLHAFRTPHILSSYRATILPPEFNEVMEQNKNKVKTAEAEAGMPFFGKRFSSLAKKIKETSKEETSAEDKEALHAKKSKPLQSFDGKVAKAIEKAEQKKKRRLERKAKVSKELCQVISD